jgi:hypothetical protein
MKNNTLPRRKTRRHCKSFYRTARDLKEFYDLSDETTLKNEETSLRLTEMAGWMICNTPEGGQLAQDIYKAIGRAWEAARGIYGDTNMSHPTEREIVRFHGELLDELERDTDPTEQAHRRNTKTPEATPRQDEPIDLNLWRQSHARPVKQCIVDAEGSAV